MSSTAKEVYTAAPAHRANPNVVCYRGGMKGHIRDQCPTPSHCLCTFCHRKGHLEAVCRTKERAGKTVAMTTLPQGFTLPEGYALVKMPATTVGAQTTNSQPGGAVPSVFQAGGWSNKNCIADSGSDDHFTPIKGA